MRKLFTGLFALLFIAFVPFNANAQDGEFGVSAFTNADLDVSVGFYADYSYTTVSLEHTIRGDAETLIGFGGAIQDFSVSTYLGTDSEYGFGFAYPFGPVSVSLRAIHDAMDVEEEDESAWDYHVGFRLPVGM